jgi:hypothetical protein
LFIFVTLIGNVKSNPQLCAGRNETRSQPVRDYCYSQNGTLILRCCLSSDQSTFLAVDFTDFNLTTVPDFTQFLNINLSVIDLRDNSELKPSSTNDFLTLTSLDQLFLPDQFDCPGGQLVWEDINKTRDPEGNSCMHQKDFCLNSTGVCVEQSSTCSTNGPSHYSCLCKSGYSGYKCLRYGKFPTGILFGSTAGITLVASVLLYWTQRRHVIK